jgi:signal recognition particle receptor subunit alpha
MLDSFEILTTSGVVLWSKTYNTVSPTIINNLIKDVFIEDSVSTAASGAGASTDTSASRNPMYKSDKYTLKWTTAKDLGLIFVVRREILRMNTRKIVDQFPGCISIFNTLVLDRQAPG